jgi:DNA-binding MltR family transcriptional regulator
MAEDRNWWSSTPLPGVAPAWSADSTTIDDPIIRASLNQILEISKKYPQITRYPHEVIRGLIIGITSVMDKAIEEMFRFHMVKDKDVFGLMFSEMGPLGSFAARARLGYLFGYYNEMMLEELLAISRIRNRMAHDIEVNTLDHPKVRDLVPKLKLLDVLLASRDKWPEQARISVGKMELLGWDMSDKTYHFLFTVCCITAVLAVRAKLPIDLADSIA